MKYQTIKKKLEWKLVFINFLFILTSIFVFVFNSNTPLSTAPGVKLKLSSLDGYKLLQNIELGHDIYEMLDLDDYLFSAYTGPDGTVNLYIGYYYDANKAYAAHSPLVCYPSQGWKIDQSLEKSTISVGPYRINYSEIITTLGLNKELVMFWYQSRFQTNTTVYRNKISMAYNKIFNKNGQHAFVRISVPMTGITYDEAKARAIDFLKAFYPEFISFIAQK